MSKQKLWVISELFYPDQTSTSYILTMIANTFVDKYEVHVITDSGYYQTNKNNSNSFFSISDSLIISRVNSRSFDKNILLQRIFKMLFLSIKFSKLVYENTRKGDKVLVVTNPAPFLILASLLKKNRKFELFILVHDVFPENTIPAGVIKKKTTLLFRLLSFMFNRAYSKADHLIVLGRDMKEIVSNKINFCNSKPEINIIENWGDIATIIPSETTTDLIVKRHKERLISIQYAGNIGRVQGLQSFIHQLNLSVNRKIFFDIWGDGAIKSELIELVRNLSLQERVNFCGIYSRDEQNSILNTTDLALVTLSSGMYGLGVPSKTYNILAAGKPILYIGDLNSEIALLIREEDIGFCFDADDSEGILKFLDNISLDDLSTIRNMGIRARKVVEEKYSEDVILNKFRNLI